MNAVMRTLTGLWAAFFLSAATLSLAHADATDDLTARVNRIESQTLVDFLTRMDSLQNQVQQMRGQIEEQAHTIDLLQQHQKDIYLELDGRLRKLEQGGAAPPPAAGGDGNTASSPAPVNGNGAPPPAPGMTDAAAPPLAAGPVSGGADNAQATYQQAFDLLKNGQYPQAIRAFHDFLGRYPDSTLANNAQYWIGEADYVSRDYPGALTEFRKVIDRYPSSSKVPDALLKIGFIHYQQSNWDQARATLRQVKTRYSGTSAARLADERLLKMKQEGH